MTIMKNKNKIRIAASIVLLVTVACGTFQMGFVSSEDGPQLIATTTDSSYELIGLAPTPTSLPESSEPDSTPSPAPMLQTEMALPTSETSGTPVVGWMGYVLSPPAGAEYDDYVVIYPEGEVGEFGIDGADEDVRAQIAALRDKEQPGKNAHFWGTLTCDVPDVGGCQLMVERLRVDGPGEFFDPDPVEAWQGTIVGFSYDDPGAPQPEDAFIPAGNYPVQYGIDSAISADSGERDLDEAIAALRGSGEIVTIWGLVICGVPDAGGCHIEVFRIESGSAVYEITPAE